jgi:hypothetical protein
VAADFAEQIEGLICHARSPLKVPGSKLAVVPNGPHSLYWEMPEVFNATVHQLLNEVYGLG